LPVSSSSQFMALFKQMSGIAYNNNKRDLSTDDYESLPTIIYRLEGSDGKPIDIESPPSSYAESLLKTPFSATTTSKYAFRVYLTEPMGTVLGANFMLGYNVIFDFDARRIGFAKSDCVHSANAYSSDTADSKQVFDQEATQTAHANNALTKAEEMFQHLEELNTDLSLSPCVGRTALLSGCNATCNSFPRNRQSTVGATVVPGVQTWTTVRSADCPQPLGANKSQELLLNRDEPCRVYCTPIFNITRSTDEFKCPIGPWSPCYTNCTQHRSVSSKAPAAYQASLLRNRGTISDSCVVTIEKRSCSTFLCPVDANVVTFGIIVKNMSLDVWSYVHKEDILHGLALTFRLDDGYFDFYSEPKSSSTGLNMEVKLKLPVSKYGGRDGANAIANAIVNLASSPHFATIVSLTINGISTGR